MIHLRLSLVISSHSASATAASNNVQAKGLDLVVGDAYQHQYRFTDAGCHLAVSNDILHGDGTKHEHANLHLRHPKRFRHVLHPHDLYSNLSVQLVGDSTRFTPFRTTTTTAFPMNPMSVPVRCRAQPSTYTGVHFHKDTDLTVITTR